MRAFERLSSGGGKSDLSDSANKNREAFRWLLLPIEVETEEAAFAQAIDELESMGVDIDDVPTWLDLEIEAWRASGGPSRPLEAVVFAFIAAGDDDLSSLLAEKYFGLHKRLAREPLLGHKGASSLLSHARLIALLASDENLSAAQIAKLIVARDAHTPVVWRHIDAILGGLDRKPMLQLGDVKTVYEADRALELEFFADAEASTCIEMVAQAARRLGFPGDLQTELEVLFSNGAVPKGPYLQMLHFQCILAEFYDHDLSAIYEFNPRGEASEWLFEQYPDSLGVAGNPFLNNAKSVDKLGREWARSKDTARRAEAHALVGIVEGLDGMGFAARRELASWVRRLLVRRIRLAEGVSIDVPDELTSGQARRLIGAIGAEETKTRGILEQRILDACCSLKHPKPDWIARGLKDSVNTTNVSRRKCGDCDFQDSVDRRVIAYEAHAGRLTDLYVRAHLRTVAAVLQERQREWAENVGPDLAWELKIVFVAHEIDLQDLHPTEEIQGVPVEVEVLTFAKLLAGFDASDSSTLGSLRDYVLGPLSRPRTPDPVRCTLLSLIADP